MIRRHHPTLAAVALAVFSLLGSSAALAAPGVDEPPVPGTPRPLQLPAMHDSALPNGVRVIVVPRADLPLVSVALHLRLGAAADPDGQAGLASLTNTLRTKGATRGGKALDATQLARQAEALGGTLEAVTNWGGSTISTTVASSKLAEALALVADTLMQPTLQAQELARLREQTADGLKFSMSDPMALAGLAARRAWWGSAVYGGSLTPASLARITLADVQAFHRQQLRPELATLVISGDVTPEAGLAMATRQLGGWRGNRMALPQARQEPASPATPATVLINLPGAGQSGVVVMAPGVPAASPQRRVAQVAGAVLGGGYSARLNTEVRIKRGLSYGASASQEYQPVGGVLSAATQTNHPTAAQVALLMQGEILKLGTEAPSADELGARQATLVGNFGRQVETTAGLAASVLDQVVRQRPLTELRQFAPEVMAVTPEQVRSYAASQWPASALRTVIVGDTAAAGDSLKALDPKALQIDAAKLDLDAGKLSR
ncbi:MAG: peptidase M16 [Burkholderiales bacterium PBB6]|nr:MAG: peptidase M16 [Burkholderiales bacterium PBB6]